MKKITSILLLLNFAIAFSQNGTPASPYYNGFNWTLTGSNLKNALATKITNTHTNLLSYTPGIWNALKIVDLDPTNSNNVLLVYGWEDGSDADVTNDRTRGKDNNSGNNGDWNREHIFAQALGQPALGQDGPGADAHMLRACDVQRNGARGNKLYASGSGNSGDVGANWYPGDEWKGDVARIIMYMYLHYGTQCLPTFVASGSTAASDSNMVELLLQWNAEDPVSQYEDNRNTYLGNASNSYGQGNRNPFIDNPYLATVIWGGQTAQNRWPTIFLATPTFDLENSVSIYPNPASDVVNISTTVSLEEIDVITINGQVLQQIKNPVIESNTFTISNLPKGFYFLKLSSATNSVTKKVLIN
ncbi:endonuclease [Flavobacterium sp.]|uniref:endonuclease n=1 Tax=Flavobacterium sp. TaxID=239 RepID=UPI00286CCF75|nr:endonuclease [Flavobacterium sp.]